MEPRLKNSVKWSPFPEELTLQITEVMEEGFSDEYGLDTHQFVIEGRIYSQEILLRVGLTVDHQLKQHNFEFSFEFDPEKEKLLEHIRESMDLVGHIWREFLEEDMEDEDMPRTWKNLSMGNNIYYYRYSTVNTALEKQADILLNQHEKKLVHEHEGVELDDDLSDNEPTIRLEGPGTLH